MELRLRKLKPTRLFYITSFFSGDFTMEYLATETLSKSGHYSGDPYPPLFSNCYARAELRRGRQCSHFKLNFQFYAPPGSRAAPVLPTAAAAVTPVWGAADRP